MPYRRGTLVLLLAIAVAVCAGQEPPSQPAKRVAPTTQQRQNDLIAIIDGQNSPQARRTAARELLLQNWSETPARLASILNGTNNPARIAVAAALTDLRQFLDPLYVDAFVAMLADADAEVRSAAASALAAYSASDVVPRLRQLLNDSDQPVQARTAAVAALGLMTSRSAIGVLVSVLDDVGSPLAAAALQALEQATAMDYNGDPAAARAWWEASREASEQEWQARQIERLVRKDRDSERRLQALESRLGKALRDNYLRAGETERPVLLQACLADSTEAVRLLGLDLVRSQMEEGKAVAPEIVGLVRGLLADADPGVRAAAVRTVATFREPADADRFVEMLASSPAREVRQALVNALGYVGTPSVLPTLLAIIRSTDDPALREAVGAVGRLAERRLLEDGVRPAVREALHNAYDQAPRADVALRERVLWAMGLVADPGFASVFVACLDVGEPAPVRQAAVRGIVALNDPKLADALVPALGDADGGVRKAAVEALAALGTGDGHLQALWGRLSSSQETDENVRQLAWRGALRLLSMRPADVIEAWIARLPDSGGDKAQRTLELLQLEDTNLAAAPASRPGSENRGSDAARSREARIGAVRARIAALQAALGQPDEAVQSYRQALDALQAAKSPEVQRVQLELLHVALFNDLYDTALVATLAGGPKKLDGDVAWASLCPEIDQRLTSRTARQIAALLEQFERLPPGPLSPGRLSEVQQRLQRARALEQEGEAAPESQPTP